MPGDAVLADENGILFLKPDMIEATAKRGIEHAGGRRTAARTRREGGASARLNGTNAKIREIVAAQAEK